MVYLIINEIEKVCKIGYSENPTARLATLQTGCPYPLTLAATVVGGVEQERQLHQDFSEYRLQGEWFQYNKFIQSYFGVVSSKHARVYFDCLPFLTKCNGAELGVVLSVLPLLGWNTNEFVLSPEIRSRVCVDADIKQNTFNAALTRLVKKNILIRKCENTYLMNPKIFFFGNDLDRNTIIKATLTYIIGE